MTTSPPTSGEAPARERGLFGPKPTVGAGGAAKTVAEDVSTLVRAELRLAKAELTRSAKAKARGIVLLVTAAIAGWLALQGLLIAAGLALALLVPGWAAALLVSAALLLVAAVTVLVGVRKLATPLSVDTTKQSIQEDLQWTRTAMQR